MATRAADDGGFTLVEVLVAAAVVGIVMTSLATMFGAGMRAAADVTAGSSASNAARSLAVYLPPDVQSADSATASTTGVGISCIGVSAPRLRLVGADGLDLVYGIAEVDGGYVLQRSDCSTGTAAGTIVVARQLSGVDAVTPTVETDGGDFAGATVRLSTSSANGEAPAVVTVSGIRRSG